MIIDKNDTYNFYKLIAADGMVITKWKDGDDIKEYNSGKLVYCPLSTDLTIYREITDEEDARLRAEQEEANKPKDIES